MSGVDRLRASRDGDQFHYQWAARQSLKLLRRDSSLVAIAVEGVSAMDTDDPDGEQVVDLAEYYGSEDLAEAVRVVYRQLKHSTHRSDKEWGVSGLSGTVEGFAKKFRKIRDELPGTEQHTFYEFVTNRPVRDSVVRAIESLASNSANLTTSRDVRHLRTYAAFGDDRTGERDFFTNFRVDPTAPSLDLLESQLRHAVTGHLPGTSDVHHVLLKEMIARRATSRETDNTVRRATVLMALATDETELLPAPNLIRAPDALVPTDQVPLIAETIVAAADEPVIVHAAGGVGKSALTSQLHQYMPTGSLTIVYDCFGDGGYRRGSLPRHQHRQGLVQLSNELAAHALSDPLVPVATAHPDQYFRAFLDRLRAVVEELTTQHPEALVTLIVDAADNAAMFARDRGEQTFVTDLVREDLPPGVRLVMLCRTERMDLLEAPPRARKIELTGFSIANTADHLRATFPAATDEQVAEFHRRTGSNPRVQAFVLDGAQSLEACLASLGETRDVDESLDTLIGRRVKDFKDRDRVAAAGIDRVCEALAALRPRIPVGVISTLCSVPAPLIHSFVADLGRPLLIDGDALQFRDEPTETWFRSHHRPDGARLAGFIERLRPLADDDAYVATSLPELLWEAGQVDVLIELAMTDRALPRSNDLEQREVAQQRVQYALKATLRAGRHFDSARLAAKAGTLAAGHSRALRLLRRNTDLAGRFLEPRVVEDLVATRSLRGGWPGSHLQHEGALLASTPGQQDLARNRLRSAVDWMAAWVRQPHEHGHGVKDDDIAEVALGLLDANGIDACIEFLARWKPNRVAFDAGLIVANRLADAGRVAELDQLAWSATKVKYLQFAVACAAWQVNHVCTARTARRLTRMLRRQRSQVSFTEARSGRDEHLEVQAVTWIVAMGLRHEVLSADEAEKILTLSLPTRLPSLDRVFSAPIEPLLGGFALLAFVRGRPLEMDEFASDEASEAAKGPAHQQSRELTIQQREIKPLAEWARVWMRCLIGKGDDLEGDFTELARATLTDYSDYETPRRLINGIVRLAGKISVFGLPDEAQQQLIEWCRRHRQLIAAKVFAELVRATAASLSTERTAFAVADLVREKWETARVAAEETAEGMVTLARAMLRLDPAEAAEHFAHARDLADRVGDEVHSRWSALTALAEAASDAEVPDHARAYRLAQIIEGLQPYLDDANDHARALTAIGRLSSTVAVSVASRWRDRRFCTEVPFVHALTAQDSPLARSPRIALAMLPFDGFIPVQELLEQTFRSGPDRARQVASAIGEFLSHRGIDQSLIERCAHVANELDIDLTSTPLAPGAVGGVKQPKPPHRTSRDWSGKSYDDETTARLERASEALRICDLRTPEGWEQARLIINAEPWLTFGQLANQAISGPTSSLSETIAAFIANPHFTILDYAEFIDRLDEVEMLPRAAVRQIQTLAHEATLRFCHQLTLKSHTLLDLEQLSRLAELTEDISATALRHLGAYPATLDASECFSLTAQLADRLSHDQAKVVLDDFTELSTQVAPHDFGDGTFATLADTPDQLDQCIGAYIWVALGDPEPSMRWRAAHCIRLLTGLQCEEELRAIRDFATGVLSSKAFVDARLPFYDKHAIQWLLSALARAAQECSSHEMIEIFLPLLKRVLFDDAPHVVMRASAKSALIALSEVNPELLTATEKSALGKINLPVSYVRTRWSERRHSGSAWSRTGPFRFFLDFNEHWCQPLADAFGLSGDDVERRAEDVVVNRWGYSFEGIDADPRSSLGVYRDRHSYVHKSEWPEIEDQGFYLAVHALWTVAGDLLAERPVAHDEGDIHDLLTQWLERYLPSRNDGRWLADRRDPSPVSVFTGEDHSVTPAWIWQLSSRHFAQRLLPNDDWVTVWEHSDDLTYEAKQEVRIHSALVRPDRARSLALALQTAPSWWGFRIPDADDTQYQSDIPGFALTGWIVVPETRAGCDTFDPLAAGVRHPPAHPCEDVAQLLGLTPDADMRDWDRAGTSALQIHVWDDGTALNRRRSPGQEGQRLQIRRQVLHEFLQTSQESLIVEVMINRTHERLKQSHTPAWRHDNDDTLPTLERSFKIYVFDAAGRCEEL
ncbi:hypothetical protein ACWEF6_06940 [Amycolatopsis sp. NPDC004772]